MTPRFALLGLLALSGGSALTVFLPFRPYMTFFFGTAVISVTLTASIAAIVPFFVSELVGGLLKFGLRGLLGQVGFALFAIGPFALVLWWIRTEPNVWVFFPYVMSVGALIHAVLQYGDRANEADLAAARRGRDGALDWP